MFPVAIAIAIAIVLVLTIVVLVAVVVCHALSCTIASLVPYLPGEDGCPPSNDKAQCQQCS